MNTFDLIYNFGAPDNGKFLLPDGRLVNEKTLRQDFLEEPSPRGLKIFDEHRQQSAMIRLTKKESGVRSFMSDSNFFFSGGEPRSATKGNWQSFSGIQIKKTSKKIRNTSFQSSVFRYEREKTKNPEILRLKAECRKRRENYEKAAANYELLTIHPKAKVKSKDGLRFILKRDNKGHFSGKIILN